MSEFVPSEQQQTIKEFVSTQSGNLAISALAGCGKTSTLVWIAKHLPKADTKIFCAFNADIVAELKSKLDGTGVSARTFHSLGLSALKRYLYVKDLPPKDTKYRDLVNKWAEEDKEFSLKLVQAIQEYPEDEQSDKYHSLRKDTLDLFVALLNLVRVKLVAWDDVAHITQLVKLNRLDVDVPHTNLVDMVIRNIEYIMKQAEAETRKQVIDFTDMIYWAVRWNLRLYPYKWVLVDEAQDFNPMQREMIAKIIDPDGGRIILVGDPNQAIYAFAGADSDSFALSVKRWNCTVLPLTVTRRCAGVITKHASRLVPDFACPPDKPRGKLVWLQEADFTTHIQLGDMVVCRVQAPLVKYCLQLIAKGIPSVIKGKDLSKSFLNLLDKLTKRSDYTFPDLLKCLTAHEVEQVEIATKKGDEGLVEAIHDQCSGLRFVIEAYPDVASIDALELKIKNLFGDSNPNNDVVTFCTVHKSKGLEADRVFILAPDKLPLRFEGITPEQLQQEYNLLYVAETRAKNVLVIVVNAKFAKYSAMPPYAQEDFEDKVWDADTTPVETPEVTVVAEADTEAPVSADTSPDTDSREGFVVSSDSFLNTDVHKALTLLGENNDMYAIVEGVKMGVHRQVPDQPYVVQELYINAEDNRPVDTIGDVLQLMYDFQPDPNQWGFTTVANWYAIASPVEPPFICWLKSLKPEEALFATYSRGTTCHINGESVMVWYASGLDGEQYEWGHTDVDGNILNPAPDYLSRFAVLLSFDQDEKLGLNDNADTTIEAESTDTPPADAPPLAVGESYINGKDHSATTTQTVTPAPAPNTTLPLPPTATDMLRTLVDQFRTCELAELDLIQQAIELIRKEKTEGAKA